MHLFVSILHVILCFALVLVILLQPAKDGAAALVGGANSMYGPRGSGHPLGRATTVIAVLFMCTSVFLAYESNEAGRADSSIQDKIKKIESEEGAGASAPAVPKAPTDAAPAGPTDAAPPTNAPAPTDAAPPTDAEPPTDAAPASAPAAPASPATAPAKDAPSKSP